MQKEQLTANSMPQKHDSQRSRQRMNEIQAYAEELRQQEAIAFSMSEVGYSQLGGCRPDLHQALIFFPPERATDIVAIICFCQVRI